MLYFARWKVVLILLAVIAGVVFTMPNFVPKETLKSWPDFLQRKIVLGLDLQGGAHLLMQVERNGIVDERLDILMDEVRDSLRPKDGERIGYTGLSRKENGVQVRIRDASQNSTAAERLRALARPIGGNNALFSTSNSRDLTVTQEGSGLFHLTLSDEGIDERLRSAVVQSIEVIRRRIDGLGTTEPVIQREGSDRILIQVPGLQDSERLKEIISSTAKLTLHLVCLDMSAEQALQSRPPPRCEVLEPLYQGERAQLVEKRAVISGDELNHAQAGFDSQNNEPVVEFRFNTSGARKFALITEQNVGRPFAIVLDNKVISAPVIREPIRGGAGQISGGFNVEAANDLAVLLRAGALPADLTIIEERTVGPGLGKDSVDAGMRAGIIGLIAVLVFMILAYGLFGLFADLALLVNIAMMLAILSLLEATLTLPGIAGIVLTIGMAVDSNVLIFERIREEVKRGRSAINAIDSGFREALRTILDANITTLIAAVVLFQLGSGPIRGFAITLAIGIVTTVFTAYTFTRLLVAFWVRRRRPNAIPI